MGADAFIAFYGIKIAIIQTDEDTLDALETRSEPRLRNAQQHGLHVHWGRLTEGEDYFLYVGHQIGLLGVENNTYIQVPLDKLTETPSACKLDSKKPVSVRAPRFTFSWKPNTKAQLSASVAPRWRC